MKAGGRILPPARSNSSFLLQKTTGGTKKAPPIANAIAFTMAAEPRQTQQQHSTNKISRMMITTSEARIFCFLGETFEPVCPPGNAAATPSVLPWSGEIISISVELLPAI